MRHFFFSGAMLCCHSVCKLIFFHIFFVHETTSMHSVPVLSVCPSVRLDVCLAMYRSSSCRVFAQHELAFFLPLLFQSIVDLGALSGCNAKAFRIGSSFGNFHHSPLTPALLPLPFLTKKSYCSVSVFCVTLKRCSAVTAVTYPELTNIRCVFLPCWNPGLDFVTVVLPQ
eukprot:gnl/TRDRNA2_/TRDRNA2_176584_c5_seq2.p1 gnl/TRDRNA2_/TRDRNA2_176584_c5~~gnl/TRDRNA2_/TRDRNA2_176584_c5_seq2.p1  ORF type:complete len:170 (+),score=2.60 gnl/TRDRNA2_/TRDRNA2_176584_c5_seq2:306-815(+)